MNRPVFRILVISCCSLAAAGNLAPPAFAGVFPGSSWETRTPAEVDLDPSELDAFAALVGGSGVIVRHGYLVYEWGSGGTVSGDWASASKPLLSTLLFVADERGLTTIHTPMADVMTGGNPKDNAITFFHLANMMSGYSRGEDAGTAWAYNDHAINLYGHALCEQVFGQPPSSVYATELAFLGFEDDVTISDVQFGRVKKMSIRDFARLGLFWLERGHWNGTQVVSDSFFDLVTNQVPSGLPATSSDGSESWNLGSFGGSDDQAAPVPGNYGMNFWVNTNGIWSGVPASVFAAIGHGGDENCAVLPDQDMVAAGIGSWLPPEDSRYEEALARLVAAVGPTAVETTSWGSVKAIYREP